MLLVPTPRVCSLYVWGGARKSAFLTGSQVVLLQVQESHSASSLFHFIMVVRHTQCFMLQFHVVNASLSHTPYNAERGRILSNHGCNKN